MSDLTPYHRLLQDCLGWGRGMWKDEVFGERDVDRLSLGARVTGYLDNSHFKKLTAIKMGLQGEDILGKAGSMGRQFSLKYLFSCFILCT